MEMLLTLTADSVGVSKAPAAGTADIITAGSRTAAFCRSAPVRRQGTYFWQVSDSDVIDVTVNTPVECEPPMALEPDCASALLCDDPALPDADG